MPLSLEITSGRAGGLEPDRTPTTGAFCAAWAAQDERDTEAIKVRRLSIGFERPELHEHYKQAILMCTTDFVLVWIGSAWRGSVVQIENGPASFGLIFEETSICHWSMVISHWIEKWK